MTEPVHVKERQVPGRKLYYIEDDVKQSAWEQITGKKTISRDNFNRLQKLGVEFRISQYGQKE